MRFTNDLNLPEAIVRAVTNDPYDKGNADFSVTGLIAPVRSKALVARHDAEIVEDVSERMFSLYGQMGHTLLERADMQAVPERFFLSRMYKDHAYKISGKGDSLILTDNGLLDDYKYTRVWAVMDGPKPEWVAQVNIYRLGLIELFGFAIERLRITALIQDWMWRQGGKGKYPDRSVVTLPIEVWPLAQTEAYLMERIAAHVDARSLDDTELPECTTDERYCGKTKWAVMIPGRKSAKKLCDILGEAEHMCEDNPTWYIEQRGGQSVRCARYCLAGKQTSFCNQWLRIQEEEAKTPVSEVVDTSALE